MASYFRSWLSTGTSTVPEIGTANTEGSFPDEGDDDGEDTETEHDDTPPAFPSLNSAQRASTSRTSSSSALPGVLTDSRLMPPPPVPQLASRTPGISLTVPSTFLSVSPSSAPAPNSNTLSPMATTENPSTPKKRAKVALAPGHSALDWAALQSSGEDLRGVDALMRITPSELKTHKRKNDVWTAINGKVYNITAYLPFHPGGEKELMRVAGRDGTALFASTHAWVNADMMLEQCMVGFMVREPVD